MLRERRLNAAAGLKADALTGATLTRSGGERVEIVPDGRGGWTLADGEAAEAEPVERLMDWLTEPTVERWASSGNGPTETDQIDLYVAGQDVTYRVDPGSGQGSRSDLDGVFELPPEVAVLLDSELRARTAIPLTLEQIDRVEVIDESKASGGGGEASGGGGGASGGLASGRVLRRLADGRYDSGTTGMSVERAARVMDVLAGLRAERYVSEPAAASTAPGPEAGGYRVVAATGEAYRLLGSGEGIWRFDDPDGATRWLTLSDADATLLASPREGPGSP